MENDTVTLIHLGNAGFSLGNRAHTVLIDGVYDYPRYRIAAAENQFSNVDFIPGTHIHREHLTLKTLAQLQDLRNALPPEFAGNPVFWIGVATETGKELAELGCAKILLIYDKDVASTGIPEKRKRSSKTLIAPCHIPTGRI